MRTYADGEVILFGPDGQPYWTFRVHKGYRRQTVGFLSPEAREQWDESMGWRRNERPPVVAEVGKQAAEEGRSGEGREASEDRA